ncbi:hypothetical protein GCM10008915_36630 [Bifidobacterium pullorum subsp. gallinarum]
MSVCLFGVAVLDCEYIDVTEESFQYNDVKFLINALTKYDGKSVEIFHDWKLRVWDDQGEVICEFYLIEVEEFKEILYDKYPLK